MATLNLRQYKITGTKDFTMTLSHVVAIAVAACALSLSGCKVEKTQEGRAPDIDVNVKDKGQMPKYDVKPADVDVGTTQTTVTVPTVDVNMPK
jgi:hypothetical protein